MSSEKAQLQQSREEEYKYNYLKSLLKQHLGTKKPISKEMIVKMIRFLDPYGSNRYLTTADVKYYVDEMSEIDK